MSSANIQDMYTASSFYSMPSSVGLSGVRFRGELAQRSSSLAGDYGQLGVEKGGFVGIRQEANKDNGSKEVMKRENVMSDNDAASKTQRLNRERKKDRTA